MSVTLKLGRSLPKGASLLSSSAVCRTLSKPHSYHEQKWRGLRVRARCGMSVNEKGTHCRSVEEHAEKEGLEDE